jgi:hypothetical protein
MALSVQTRAKVPSQVRIKTLMITEKALHLWLEGKNRKCVPIEGNVLQEKARSLYKELKLPIEEGQTSDRMECKASQGCLNSFMNRLNHKNMQPTHMK